MVLTALAPGCRSADRRSLEELPRFGLEPELTIDRFVPDLGPIRWVGVASDGTIAVSQVNDHLIRLLDASGQDLGSVGGAGGGEGRGRAGPPIQGGAGWIGDTLWVGDVTLGRIALYRKGLELARTLPPLPGARPRAGEEGRYPGFLSVWPVTVLPGDTLLVLADQSVGGPPGGPLSRGKHLLRVSARGEILRPLVQVSEGAVRERGAGDTGPLLPLARSSELPLFHVGPAGDRIAVVNTDREAAESGTWWLRVVDAYGQVLLDRHYGFREAPVPTGVVVAADHGIWIGLREPSGEPSWVAFTPGGDPVGRVSLPRESRLLAVHKDQLWATGVDRAGAPEVVRCRLVPPG